MLRCIQRSILCRTAIYYDEVCSPQQFRSFSKTIANFDAHCHTFDVNTGDGLLLDFKSHPSHLTISCGGHEDVAITSTAPLQSSQHQGTIAVSPAPTFPTDKPTLIQASIPTRFFNLQAHTKGGDITVELIHEAAQLALSSQGGNIHVQKAKATNVDINSDKGSLKGSITGQNVLLRGANIDLKNLVAESASLSLINATSGGGNDTDTAPTLLSLGPTYVKSIDINSNNNPIDIKSLSADEASIQSGGGHIRLRGIDGSVNVSSYGGDISVQLYDKAKKVILSSGGGNIVIHASPGLYGGEMKVKAAKKVVGRLPGIELSPSSSSSGWKTKDRYSGGVEVPLSRLQVGQVDEIEGVLLEIDAGEDGCVEIKERNWLDAVLERGRVEKNWKQAGRGG